MISVDQEDSVGNHRMDVRDTLNKNRISKEGTIINEPITGFIHTDKLEEAITKQEGCMITGFVPITKVKGDIHISFHNYADLYNYLRIERKDLFEKISMNHKLTFLNFGDISTNDVILKRFNLDHETNEHSAFNNPNNLPNFVNENTRKSYDYFIKLIPHIFDDFIHESEEKFGYQYSMTSRSKDFNADSNQMPIVVINYDFSPISMRFNLESKSVLHSITHVCAIVGGVFVIFSILNRVFLSFFEFSSSSERK